MREGVYIKEDRVRNLHNMYSVLYNNNWIIFLNKWEEELSFLVLHEFFIIIMFLFLFQFFFKINKHPSPFIRHLIVRRNNYPQPTKVYSPTNSYWIECSQDLGMKRDVGLQEILSVHYNHLQLLSCILSTRWFTLSHRSTSSVSPSTWCKYEITKRALHWLALIVIEHAQENVNKPNCYTLKPRELYICLFSVNQITKDYFYSWHIDTKKCRWYFVLCKCNALSLFS